jgi:hypothetical protein
VNVLAYEVVDLGEGYILIRSSDGKSVVSRDLGELLAFLRYSSKDVVRVFMDLDEAVAPILRKVDRGTLGMIAERETGVSIGGHHVFYSPDRVLQVGWTRYFGLKTFYGYPEYAPDVTLEETQGLAEDLAATLGRMGLGDSDVLTCAVTCFEQSELGRKTYEELPKSWQLPSSVLECLDYANTADHKDWWEARQIGHWPSGLYDWDKTSCYASIASSLFDLRDMTFWKSSSLGRRESGACYGFLRGRFYIDPGSPVAYASPIVARVVNDLQGNPQGRLPEDTYTLDEVRTVEGYGIGEFRLADGWFLAPSGGVRPRQPLRDIMAHLYQMRSLSLLASSIAKGVGNQMVGMMIERRDRDDGIRNEIYHALITARTRCEITKFLIENEIPDEALVAVQCDGVRITKELPMPTKTNFGQWRCNGDPPTIVCSPRKVYSLDKKPYRVTYDDILAMVGEHPLGQRYVKGIQRHITLLQAKAMGDIYRVGEYAAASAKFDMVSLAHENCRVFPNLPKTGRALLWGAYSSKPIIMLED